MFYKEGCPHCLEFDKIYSQLESDFPILEFYKIENHLIPDEFNEFFGNQRTYPNVILYGLDVIDENGFSKKM